jgi:hypothetical protein
MKGIAMKRLLISSVIILFVASGAVSQVRLDVGATASIATWIPIPDIGLHYQFDLHGFKLGLGMRGTTLIVYSTLFTNAFVELEIGRFALDAQVGGGLFAFSQSVQGSSYGVYWDETAIADLSAWWMVGKRKQLRLGAGAICVLARPGEDEDSSWNFLSGFEPVPLPYLAGKLALDL